ncbi:uncharacterized protein LOC132731893 [Ruditapes philippinarum]|uniref:uncharacterized protein LOC132731893 n=1 Tax=Ruditapes philippinarum TaxID=129788 RepID=UPI00295B91F9|nr:uncharacterized protein LOC132731893 [Ruditapes philippinarum]
MKDSNLRFVLLLAVIVSCGADSAVSEDESEEEMFNCDRYENIVQRFSECFRSRNTTGYSILMTRIDELNIVTRGAFLAQITSLCSDEQINEAYTRCTRDIVSVCPELTETINDVVREKVSFLCENNQPSSWIRGVLNEDYMLNMTCFQSYENEVLKSIHDCFRKTHGMMSEIKKIYAQTLSMAREQYKRALSDLFQCTASPYYGDTTLSCGSKKKEVLLTYWIVFSVAIDPLTPPIGPQARNKLTEMMSPLY